MVDGLVCNSHFCVTPEIVSCVMVAVEIGKIGTCDIKSDPVALTE